MNRIARLIVFLLGATGLAALFILAFLRLPGPDDLRNRTADRANALTVPARHTTNAVSTVNFDYRAFDTIGEEFILFVSVMGVLVLFRETHAKPAREILRDSSTPGRDLAPSDAIRAWTLVMVAPKILFGLYIIAHGALTPGGGFQGGVILATAPLILFLATDFRTFQKIASFHLVEITEAFGAAAFVLIGVVGLFAQRAYLTNVLPMGTTSRLTSGGMIPLISVAVGLEVAAGFVLLLYVFLQESLTVEHGEA